MNMANESIIICDTPPRISRQNIAADSKNKMPFVPKNSNVKTTPKKELTKIHCETPSKKYSGRKTFRQKKRKRLEEKNLEDCMIEELIVISDDETDKSKDCIPLMHYPFERSWQRSLRRSLRLHNVMKRKEQKEKTSISGTVASATPDNTCLIVSDTDDAEAQDTVNVIEDKSAEILRGIDANQASNDIMVLWSSNDQAGANIGDTQFSEKINERLFMIDISPDPKNLTCLLPDSEPAVKRRKIEHSSLVKRLHGKGNIRKRSNNQRTRKLSMLKQANLASVADKKTTLNRVMDHSSSEILIAGSGIEAKLCTGANTNVHHLRSNAAVGAGALREIIVDGSNIAMAYTNGKTFSEHGIKLVIEYFLKRGHSVKVFVPQHRRSIRHKYLEELYSRGIVVFTPSRNIGGKKITPYDDRFILQYATMRGGIVVSLDQYRDLYTEKPEWRDTIEKRLLAPTFVDNYVMFPEDPLGRYGPKLDAFLRH